jgi:hypothetical protein
MRTAIIQEKGPARGNNADLLAPIPDAGSGALFFYGLHKWLEPNILRGRFGIAETAPESGEHEGIYPLIL